MTRRSLPARRGHITQKLSISNARTLYLSVDAEPPNEVFLRIRGDAGAEKTTCFDVIARLISVALQEGVPLARLAKQLHGTKTEPAGAVRGDKHIKYCNGTLDLIGRHLLVYYCGREDLAHVKEAP